MMLVPNWRKVLKHAWSVRLIVLAGLLTGCEGILPLLPVLLPSLTVQIVALVTFAVLAAAVISRFIAQEKVSGGDHAEDQG